MIDSFVWTNSTEPREVLSTNDEINDLLLWIETHGCGIRDAGGKVCEDYGCKSIIEVIEWMSAR